MDQEKVKQLETEVATAMASLRKLLSDAQATSGALDVFIYQLKKELATPEVEVIPPAQ